MTETCYFCGEGLVDRDHVVPIPVRQYRPQESGYLLAGGEKRLVHTGCLKGMD